MLSACLKILFSFVAICLAIGAIGVVLLIGWYFWIGVLLLAGGALAKFLVLSLLGSLAKTILPRKKTR